jgi:hypothetical protein
MARRGLRVWWGWRGGGDGVVWEEFHAEELPWMRFKGKNSLRRGQNTKRIPWSIYIILGRKVFHS